MTLPDFDSLDSDAIRALDPQDLGAALSQAMMSLQEGSDALEGALELADAADVTRLREALWEVHMGDEVADLPSVDPYAEAETSELQEACAALLTRACAFEGLDLPASLAPLGSENALTLVMVIEDWESRYQPEDLDL